VEDGAFQGSATCVVVSCVAGMEGFIIKG